MMTHLIILLLFMNCKGNIVKYCDICKKIMVVYGFTGIKWEYKIINGKKEMKKK